ncbi:MAG TPA: long-chain fatty acid--CoA ligase [Acidimicrobiia bacterium]|jgi:long-chain acyl-CoA synthetase
MSDVTSSVPTASAPDAPGAAGTIVELFRRRVVQYSDRVALRRNVDGRWEPFTWREYGEAVAAATAGLVQLGVEPGDRVGLLSMNRLDWHVADLGILAAAAVTVPVYPTSAAEQVAYILRDAGARVCFVEDRDQLAKVLEHRDELAALEHVVVFDTTDVDVDRVADPDAFCTSIDALRALGEQRLVREPELPDARADAVAHDALATLVYTSGTTGPPRGAMITHANVMGTVDVITKVVTIGPDDRFLSFLPLSHIAERTVSHFGQIVSGGETWFARSLATLAEDLPQCRPTIFFAVPRVWEKLREAILARVKGERGLAHALGTRYLELGPEAVAEAQGRARMGVMDKVLYDVLDRVVGARIRSGTGLDRARVLVSGAAPIHVELLEWLHGVGLRVGEVYGQTEDCGPTTLNPPDAIRIGTVGPPLPGVDVRIADDGEILVKGPNVCQGYFNDDAATRELIDADGWMHSGDVGHFDDAGYLVVTDRKKDLIITAQGKNIAPREIETRLRYEPLVSQVVVIGEGRPYLTALITLDPDQLVPWARTRGKPLEPEALVWDPDLRAAIDKAVAHVNGELSRPENIRKWRILPHDFTVASGELTPTLKVKRNVVSERYADVIGELYAEPR